MGACGLLFQCVGMAGFEPTASSSLRMHHVVWCPFAEVKNAHHRNSPAYSAVLGWKGAAKEAGEQLVDALGLVVMDPMRCVGQALNAVEVGYVVVVRLG